MARQIIEEGFPTTTKKKLNDNFAELYAGGGGSLILTSLDGTHWLVGVNNLGVLTTEETVTAGAASTTLTSPNGTGFTLGVNNAGALTTEEVA